jgi:hypothetical protein
LGRSVVGRSAHSVLWGPVAFPLLSLALDLQATTYPDFRLPSPSVTLPPSVASPFNPAVLGLSPDTDTHSLPLGLMVPAAVAGLQDRLSGHFLG